jgi:hypothetical protein
MPKLSQYRVLNIGTAPADGMIAAPSPRRVAIVIGPAAVGTTVVITPDPTATSLTGFVLAAGQPPLTLTAELHGDIVGGAWYASAAAATKVAVLEVSAVGETGGQR